MDIMSMLFAGLLSLAIPWCGLAVIWKLVQLQRIPQPAAIPLSPAPRTIMGVLQRLFLEAFLFRSLWRASPVTWVAAVLFHYGLLFVVLMHLRLLFQILPVSLVPLIVYSGWATAAMAIGLVALLARRILVDRVRYITTPSDILHLLLLGGILASGTLMKRLWPSDLHAVGAFLRGVLTLQWQPLPSNSILYVHLLCIVVLLLIFPISKLMHAPGLFLAPTFLQRDPGKTTGPGT